MIATTCAPMTSSVFTALALTAADCLLVGQDAQDEVQRQRVLKAKAIKKMQRVRHCASAIEAE